MLDEESQHRHIGGFELLEQIGEGGMATVWKACQTSVNRIVALKLLNRKYSENPEFIQRFRNEASAAANLTHKHIVQVYDAGRIDEVDYLAMEFVEGTNVFAKLEKQGKMSETEALDTIIPIAQALQYAWDRAKLIHRDIKPENILIDQDGTVKLVDLGLARSTITQEDLKITKPGQSLGTPFYVSPEQAEGKADLDFRTDIYALGATLYHLVTGHAPFENLPTAEIFVKQVDGMLPDARNFHPQLSEALCMVIEKMMAKDRDERYLQWQALVSDLQLVRSSRRPVNARLMPGRSTMQRRENVDPSWRPSPSGTGPVIHIEPTHFVLTPVMWAGIGVIVACLIGMGALLFMSYQRERALQEANLSATRANDAARIYYEAIEFANNHNSNFDEILKRFQEISQKYDGTEFASRARDQIEQRKRQHEEALKQKAMEAAVSRATPVATVAPALPVAKPPADDKAEREQKALAAAREAEEKKRQAAESVRLNQAAQVVYNEFCVEWVDQLSNRRDYKTALQLVQKYAVDPRLAPRKELLNAHLTASQQLITFENRLLAPDSPLLGRTVSVNLPAGVTKGTVTAVSATRGVTFERNADVAVSMNCSIHAIATEDLLQLAREDLIDYALLFLAEHRLDQARAALLAAPEKSKEMAERYRQMIDGILVAEFESKASTLLKELRVQLTKRQWLEACNAMLDLDLHYANTAVVQAAATELKSIHDQLLALPLNIANAEPVGRLTVLEARRAAENKDWKRAYSLMTSLETLLSGNWLSLLAANNLESKMEVVRLRLVAESGLPEVERLSDLARRRAVQKNGGRIWNVKGESPSDPATLADAFELLRDGDAIELGQGVHVAHSLNRSQKKNILIYGRAGSLPVITYAAGTEAGATGNYLIACGDGWQLENLHFRFAATALDQRGPNLKVSRCAFSCPTESRGSSVVLKAECDGTWQSGFENCLIAAKTSDVVMAQPQNGIMGRYTNRFDQCTIWLPEGSLHNTAQVEQDRRFFLNLRNSVVLAKRFLAPSWSPELLKDGGLIYQGRNNLLLLVSHTDGAPAPGDDGWKKLFPDQDAASIVAKISRATVGRLTRGQPVAEIPDFTAPAENGFQLVRESRGVKMAEDGGEVGVRWPAWRWELFAKNLAHAGTNSSAGKLGEGLAPITVPVLTESQKVLAANVPIGKLFKGTVRTLVDGRVELTYDFSSPEQLADWRSISSSQAVLEQPGSASKPGRMTCESKLLKVVLERSGLMHKARFKGEADFQCLTAPAPATGVVSGLLSFPTEHWSAALDLAGGLRLTSHENNEPQLLTNLTASVAASPAFTLHMSMQAGKLTQNVPTVGMLETPLPASHATCEVGFAAVRGVADFSKVRVTGTLDPTWLEAARARVVLGTEPHAVAGESGENLVQEQRLKAAAASVLSQFKGRLTSLGDDRYEWFYDFTRPQFADWETETPGAWTVSSPNLTVASGLRLVRKLGQAKPYWFRARLRGDFKVAWLGQVVGAENCGLVVRYGTTGNAPSIVAGINLPEIGFGIGRFWPNGMIEKLDGQAVSVGTTRVPAKFSFEQTGDLLKLQVQLKIKGVEQPPILIQTRNFKNDFRNDTVVSIGFDGDNTSQFEVEDISITGALDPEWIRTEQGRTGSPAGR